MPMQHPIRKTEPDSFDSPELRQIRRERDAARLALAQAQEDRLRAMANLSHELRTPLNAILGYAELSMMTAQDDTATRQRYLETIREAGSYLLSIVESVLDMSKLRAGSLALAENEFAPGDCIEAVIRVLTPLADKVPVSLVARVPANMPMILADAQVIRQILINLASNAIKASPPRDIITITAAVKRNGSLQFEVRDCGAGMDPSTIKRVMQPFVQAADAQGFGSCGTGLGLPLVRTMAELHDGRFQLVSHVGRGTRAIVTIPASRVLKPAHPGQQVEFAFTRTPLPFGR
jgi:two-component system, cell cycle sensor histidine kinase PleC